MSDTADNKELVLDEVRRYHRETAPDREFVPGVTEIWPSGAVLDEEDRVALVEAALTMRIAAGPSSKKFESAFAKRLKRRKAHLTNSGSSANLLAVSALMSHQLGDRRLKPGDEVITVAAGFPTTVNPILQNGLLPVFVDVNLATYNTTADRVAAAIGPKTRAIIIAHALGNPFEVAEVAQLAKDHDLFLIEDNCDAVGSTYDGQITGTFGDLTTVSFYPAHHLTMGEGGCVLTSDLGLARIVESLRDWGRDCWCEPGKNNTCFKRFEYQMGNLPAGYDHKYIFSHVGYNLKGTDIQAALGLTQLTKLDGFIEARRRNWRRLREDWTVCRACCSPSRPRGPSRAGSVSSSPSTPRPASHAPNWSSVWRSGRSAPGGCSPATSPASRPTSASPTASSATSPTATSSPSTPSGSVSTRVSPTKCSTT